MARLYADEDFPKPVVEVLRTLGHDVLTVQEAGRQSIKDDQQLTFAAADQRAILTHNRKDFKRLHKQNPAHHGIIICTRDEDDQALADRIHQAVEQGNDLRKQLLSVTRPQEP